VYRIDISVFAEITGVANNSGMGGFMPLPPLSVNMTIVFRARI
jgi:hypothetical protein